MEIPTSDLNEFSQKYIDALKFALQFSRDILKENPKLIKDDMLDHAAYIESWLSLLSNKDFLRELEYAIIDFEYYGEYYDKYENDEDGQLDS